MVSIFKILYFEIDSEVYKFNNSLSKATVLPPIFEGSVSSFYPFTKRGCRLYVYKIGKWDQFI